MPRIDQIRAGVLDVAVERHGSPGGPPVVLLHGFPYSPRGYDEVVGPLAERGADVVVPYLRGYGPTRFLDAGTPRSGQQAALAHDLRELIDALGLERPVVVGYDWGGRAACLVAMLWPQRVAGLVTVGGYNVQDIAHSGTPAPPEHEHRLWYQYYLHSERGRNGLQANRAAIARLLWSQWSPNWAFDDATFEASAAALENPDFVEVVAHSYRHRFGMAPGDPAYEESERVIARQPKIEVPTVILAATEHGFGPPAAAEQHTRHFTDIRDHRELPTGHNPPQEAPAATVEAIVALRW